MTLITLRGLGWACMMLFCCLNLILFFYGKLHGHFVAIINSSYNKKSKQVSIGAADFINTYPFSLAFILIFEDVQMRKSSSSVEKKEMGRTHREQRQVEDKTSQKRSCDDLTIEEAQVREGKRKCQYQRLESGQQGGSCCPKECVFM